MRPGAGFSATIWQRINHLRGAAREKRLLRLLESALCLRFVHSCLLLLSHVPLLPPFFLILISAFDAPPPSKNTIEMYNAPREITLPPCSPMAGGRPGLAVLSQVRAGPDHRDL